MNQRFLPHLPKNDYDPTAGCSTVLPLTASYAHDQKYDPEIRFPNVISSKILIHGNIRISKKTDFSLDFIPDLPHIASQICKQHD
jgi:hypothetical protein